MSIWCFSPPWSASPRASACGRRCWRASWRRCATISSSCRRSILSPSPIPTNVAAFFFFMLIALLVSNVAARVRSQADTAIGRVRTTESLYAFSRKLAGTATLDDVLWATAYQTALMLKVRVVLLLPEEGVLTVKSRLSAGGRTRQGRSRRRQLGLEQRPAGRARLGHAAGRQAAVPADADRARRDRRHRHRRRPDRAPC